MKRPAPPVSCEVDWTTPQRKLTTTAPLHATRAPVFAVWVEPPTGASTVSRATAYGPQSATAVSEPSAPIPFPSSSLSRSELLCALAAASHQKEETAANVRVAAQLKRAAEEHRQSAVVALEAARRNEARVIATATSAACEWTRLFAAGPNASIAQHCYKDALHCIFAFLPLHCILPGMRSCRSWYIAAASEKSRNMMFRPLFRHRTLQLYSSPLRKHVTSLHHPPLSSDSMWLLRLQMPHLSALTLSIGSILVLPQLRNYAARFRFVRQFFPPALRCLTVEMPSTVDTCQAVLDALCGAPALTELKITMSIKWSRKLDLVPLMQLAHLVKLTLSIGCCFTVQQLAVIGSMHTLSRLHLNGGRWRKATHLSWLCKLPHLRLDQLEELNLTQTEVNDAMMIQLSHFPVLGILEPFRLHPSAYPLLPLLPRLHTLRVRLSDISNSVSYPGADERNVLCCALRACSHLTDVTIEACRDGNLLAAFLIQLLQSLPQLRCLKLKQVNVPSLSFLNVAPQLEAFHLHDCVPKLPAAEVLALHAPQLLSLELVNASVLSRNQLELLQPPSRLFPSLLACTVR
jgi:hypothetical protein